MMNKDTYLKELTRYFNSVRDDKYKGEAESASCIGVLCTDCIFNNEVSRDSVRTKGKGEKNCFWANCYKCQLFKCCGDVFNAYEAIEEIEKWSKEHKEGK